MQAQNDSTRDTLLFIIDRVLAIMQHVNSSPGLSVLCRGNISFISEIIYFYT